MNSTGIKTLVVKAQLRYWVFVKIETDVPGLYGWGEGTLEWKTRAVAGCVEDFKPLVLQEILEQMVFHPDGFAAEW